MSEDPVAVLYQAALPPPVNGIHKPMKPGGYSDSGADIAFNLASRGVPVVSPVATPDPEAPWDWVFPDTGEGIAAARAAGARVLWANTILFSGHPLETLRDLRIVGQLPAAVQQFDDKWITNELLRAHGVPVARSILIGDPREHDEASLQREGLAFPLVVKPVRGRGSQGVTVVPSLSELRRAAGTLLSATVTVEGKAFPTYGDRVIVEQFLPGTELTVTVLPPGTYRLAGAEQRMDRYWSLPPVRRFHHHAGVAPYNGVVAVACNSELLPEAEWETPAVRELLAECARAAALVGARAPIRIDARATAAGRIFLFDLNMKPNMTGPGRPGREGQESLCGIAGRGVGWDYPDLLLNILAQAWNVDG
jgi:D-alanine-D-alanine ligase-like ATP-grasp enzyme